MRRIMRRYSRRTGRSFDGPRDGGHRTGAAGHDGGHARRAYRPGLRHCLEPRWQDCWRPPGLTIPCASGTPPRARRSRNTRGTPSSSWRSPSHPTANIFSPGARITPPKSGMSRPSGPAKTFAGHPAGARGPCHQARRQAIRRGSGQVGQDLGLDDRGSVKDLAGHAGDVAERILAR